MRVEGGGEQPSEFISGMQRLKRLSNQFDVKNPDEKKVLNNLSKSQDDELHLPKCTLVPLGIGWRGGEGLRERKGEEAEGSRVLCVRVYGNDVELLSCCLCAAKALTWAVWDALPNIPILPALNGFHYPCLECRRYFFQTVIHIYKQNENAEEADAGPTQSQMAPGNFCPTEEARGGKENPLSHLHSPGLFPAGKAQAPFHHPLPLSFATPQLPVLLFCSMPQ